MNDPAGDLLSQAEPKVSALRASIRRRRRMMDWKPIDETPESPMPVVLYFGRREFRDMSGAIVALGDPRDATERMDIGFWDGTAFRMGGTGHEAYEDWWMTEDQAPTLWTQLNSPA